MDFILKMLRSLNLRCPNCQQGRILRNWIEVNRACSSCGYVFMQETGDFWGGMVFSYTYAGFTALAVAGVLIALDLFSIGARVYAAVLAGAASILLLHPITRANWVTLMFLTRGHYEEYRPPAKKE
jgi:uncharacterized protein (DUF983 family)